MVRTHRVFFLLLGWATLTWAQISVHRLTLEDLLSAEPIGETALSPDGKTFAFTRNSEIVLMPSEGGWPVTLTSASGSKTGLNWSPDGRTLAYASGGSIWTVAVLGGAPKRLTHAVPGEGDPRTAGDRNPQWSPKGRWILFETGRRGHNNLMVVSADGTVNNFLTGSSADEDAATWSPDGEQIAYVERAPQYFSGKLNVLKIDPKSGEAVGDPATLYSSPTDRGGGWSLHKPEWSPDRKALAVVLQANGWDNLYLIPTAGGTPKQITRGNWEDTSPAFSPDGKELAFESSRNNLEARAIWISPVSGGAPRRADSIQTPGIETSPQWSPDGKKLYFHRASPLESTDLIVADQAMADQGRTSDAKYLTHTTPQNLASAFEMPEKVTYKSKDGLEIAAILYKPHGSKVDAPGPAVLWIHGGPEGEDTLRFDVWAQYLAQAGYAVLEPNYRGSSGYGEKFRNLNVEDSGGRETDDVAAGAQHLVDHGLADPKRLAIGGGSHGGTMVAYAVTQYPDLFAAAIELYGVVDRATFLERTNHSSAIRWAMKMGGTQAEKPDVYRKANSLLSVFKVKAPLLIMHGENDPQVPPFESVQFTRALKENNKVFYYFTYPGELHGFTQREHRLDAWRKQLAFLQKYIQPKYGLSSTSTDDVLFPATAKKTDHSTEN
ncbi:MAG TPA: S9 family peptidase [Bryobacteraceae bacterium]|nr:S9 family peptidase [Bryobacteraceae bacterium]